MEKNSKSSKRSKSKIIRAKRTMPSRKYVNKIFEWCIMTYGRSKHNRTLPEIRYRRGYYPYNDPSTIAFYDGDMIFIKKEDHKNLYKLANSIIHEYTHYIQNPHHYDVLSKYISYKYHPMEKEANAVANRDTRKCLREIMLDE